MKQTEVGLIPDDWEVIKLGDKVDIFRGGSPRPIERYITTNANGINWIKIGDVRPNDKYIRQTEEKIILEGKSRSREVKKGDFILSNSMSFGRPYILNIDGCIHDGWLTIQNYTECFDKEFLYYLLGSDEVFTQYVQMAAGSSVQNLNKEKVADLQLKVPPLPEQQRIAKALSDVDALISTTEKLIQKKKNIKQGAMQNLLTGKKRLPGFGNKQTDLFVPNGTHTKEVKDVSPEQIRLSAKMKQTKLGEIPEDWEVKSIKDFAKVYDGTHQTPHYVDVGIPFYSVENVTANDFEHTKLISEKEHRLLTSKVKIEKGDILMTRIGSIGDCKYIDWEPEASFYVSLALIKCDTSVDARFISYYSNSLQFKKELELRSLITAIPQKINLGPISEIILVLPPKEEQTAIANVLSSMDKEIETLNTKLEKYRNLKTAMMQQLLTGKIRFI